MIANKSVLGALNHCEKPSLPFDSRDDVQCVSAGDAVERRLRHGELESLLRASLFKSASLKNLAASHSRCHSPFDFTPTSPAPVNPPSLTPSNSFSDDLLFSNGKNALTGASDVGEHSDYPSPDLSSSSTPAFDLSLISNSFDCPDEEFEGFHPFEFTSISSDPVTLENGIGLGITGVSKRDGSGEFDGIGLVSLRRWIPRSACIPSEANPYIIPFPLSESFPQNLHDDGNLELSDTFLQEAVITFIQDPLHKHSLATIPECQSWSELDLNEGDTRGSVSSGELENSHAIPVPNHDSTSDTEAPLRRMKRHFSASTISSELKRISVSSQMNHGGRRVRSSTWPSHALSRLHQEQSGDGNLRVVN